MAKTKQITDNKDKLTTNQLALLDNLTKYTSIQEAAKAAGYSDKTASNIKALIKRSPALMNRIKDIYLANTVTQLHDIMVIEDNVLSHCKEKGNVDNVPKHAQMLKQIKQSAGVLDQDQAPKAVTININTIEKIQVAMADVLRSRMIPVACDDDDV